MTIARKKVAENTENGENGKKRENIKNSKYLRTNLV